MADPKCRAFVLTGPSGAGKSTIVAKLMARHNDLRFSVSATTRAPRAGETEGKDYFFLTVETFRTWLKEDRFLEHATVHGNYYGTPREAVEKQLKEGYYVLMDIDVQGARSVHEKMPEAHLIFIMPPSFEELERRLRGRATDSEEVIERRLAKAKSEMAESVWFDHVVVNDDVDRAANELEDLIYGGNK